MNWLCEVTVDEMMRVGKDAETIPELRSLVEEYVQERITKRQRRKKTLSGV
jgi:hypothetical protein